MPVKTIKKLGKPVGARFGKSGKLFTFSKFGVIGAHNRARAQGRAIKSNRTSKMIPRVVKVKKNSRQGKNVSSHKRRVLRKKRVILKKKYAKLIGRVSGKEFKNEHGGLIDFNLNGDLDRFTTEVGAEETVDVPDFEVNYHTHPPGNNSSILPSAEDITSLVNSKNIQSEIIFKDGGQSLSINKNSKTKKYERMSNKEVLKHFEKLDEKAEILAGNNPKTFKNNFAKEWKKILAEEGIKISKINRKNQSIKLPINPVE